MRRILTILGLSVALDVIFGVLFAFAQHIPVGTGLYFATTTASTVGYGDVTPHGWVPHVIAVAMMITVIPLFASVFSLFTTALTTAHVDRKHKALMDKMHEHHEALLKHVTAETAGCGPAVPVELSHGGRGGDQGSDSSAGGERGGASSDDLGRVPGSTEYPPYVSGAPYTPDC